LGSLATAVLGDPAQVATRVAQIGHEVGLTIAETLTISALVTLDDRVQRIAGA
jgi:hypothetical protein